MMLNKTQIEDGYAQLWVIPPNDRYEDELRRAQEEARELTMGFGVDIWSLKPAEDRLLADHGNGIGKGDGGCPPKPHTASPSASASATASPEPNAFPNPKDDCGGGNGSPSPASPEPNSPPAVQCEPPAYPVPPGDERDGDNDGCAGEV